MQRAVRVTILAIVVMQAVLITLVATAHGPAVSPDSREYLSGAASLANGLWPVAADGSPLTLFPLGLPVLLALAQVLGFSATAGAIILNVVSLAVIIVGTYALGTTVLASHTAGLVAAAFTGVSASFLATFVWIWTEPVFTAVVVILLVLMSRAIQRGVCTWWIVVVAGVLTSIAVTFRYAGLALVPVTVLAVWWAGASLETRIRAARTVTAGLLSIVAPAVLILRNLALGSGPLGDRAPGARTLLDSLVDAVAVVGGYVLPPESSSLGVVLGTCAVILVAAGAWTSLVMRDRSALVLALFAVLYTLTVVASQTVTRLDETSARLLSPALPAMVILGFVATRRVLRRMGQDAQGWIESSPDAWVRRHGGRTLQVTSWALVIAVAGVLVVAAGRADMRMVDEVRGAATGEVLGGGVPGSLAG